MEAEGQRMKVSDRCLQLLHFPESILRQFYGLPDTEVDGTLVPAAFVRSKIPRLCALLPFDRVMKVDDLSTGATAYFSLRSIAWAVQCGTALEISSIHQGLPCAHLRLSSSVAIPHFIRWIEGNDEETLREAFNIKLDPSGIFLENFCQLVRRFRCVDKRLLSIILDAAWLCETTYSTSRTNGPDLNIAWASSCSRGCL